jgi:hypothetical protein
MQRKKCKASKMAGAGLLTTVATVKNAFDSRHPIVTRTGASWSLSRSSNNFGHFSIQGTVQQSEGNILLSMSFSLDLDVKAFGERSQLLSCKALSFSSNP